MNIAFLNAVHRNGGKITPELRKQFGVTESVLAEDGKQVSTVTIPDDWASLHWKKRAALAAEISGNDIGTADEADAIIKAELGKRGPAEPERVTIPDDWENLSDEPLVKLALAIVGGDGQLAPAEGQTEVEKAKAIINAEVEDRASSAT